MILSYPVITSGEFAHRGSFNNLLRDQYTEEMLEKTSLEKQVNEYVPRAFIWHTYEDTVVPVENSLLFATELRRHHIPVEFHLFERGCHGLSLANELTAMTLPPMAAWIGISKRCLGISSFSFSHILRPLS